LRRLRGVGRRWGRDGRGGWQRDLKDRSVRAARDDRKLTAVIFDDRATDRQPHPHAVGFGGEERLENALGVLRIDAVAGVLDRDQEAGWLRGLSLQPQEPLTIRHRAHGVSRIGDQIHHHLAQLNRVGVNGHQALGQRCVDRDMVIFQIAAHEREHLADQRIDVKGGERRAAMPENQVDFLDNRIGAAAIAGDAFECRARLLDIGGARAKASARPRRHWR